MNAWWQRRTLRSRLLAVGVAGVAGALLVGWLLLYAVLSAALDRAIATEVRASAAQVAAFVEDDRVPDPLPVGGALVVQVVDGQRRVVAASVSADRLTPLLTAAELDQALAGAQIAVPGSRAGVPGSLRVVALAAGPPGARMAVVAGSPTAELDSSRAILRTVFLVFYPVFLVGLAMIAWGVIGSVLRPVEQLRLGAERIGGAGSADERLPVPPSGDEVSALASTLNAMLDRLAQARSRQRAFVADAAHELRSPLATLHTQLEVAARVGVPDGLAQDLLADVQRMGALVEDLLTLARADDAPPVRAVPVDLAALARDLAGSRSGARVPVRVQVAAAVTGDPGVTGDPAAVVRAVESDVRRAVGNLLDNAVRHAATAVTLEVEATAEAVTLAVVDDGHGIPPADRERVFERFTRLDPGRARDSGGSGLGLAICRELLARNGATVRLLDAHPGIRAVVAVPRRPPC
ncbi:MAG: ATP-binding protein [Dermatophilaceae bacterium]